LPNFLEYQKSVAAEFMAYEKRVRYLIDDANWAEEGRYKEIILRNYLKRVLPKHISVGTGFIRNKNRITSQIDIIIYDQSYPLLFSEGEFIVAVPENVVGIMEVKTSIKPGDLCDIIQKANENASIICGDSARSLFNGIFSFNSEGKSASYIRNLKEFNYDSLLERQNFIQIVSNKLLSCVNHIAVGKRFFVKLWPTGLSQEMNLATWQGEPPHYSFYDMSEGLAFSYCLSNLQEEILKMVAGRQNENLPEEMQAFLYPLPEGKLAHLVERIVLD
jgi:hypothetical protein